MSRALEIAKRIQCEAIKSQSFCDTPEMRLSDDEFVALGGFLSTRLFAHSAPARPKHEALFFCGAWIVRAGP